MTLTYEIWDKQKPINGCDAQTAIQSLGIKANEEVYIIYDSGRAWIVQTNNNTPFPAATLAQSAELHIADIKKNLPTV